MRLTLPLMYVALNQMLAYGYAEAVSLDGFEQIRRTAEARGKGDAYCRMVFRPSA